MPILTTSGLCLIKAGSFHGSAASPFRNASGAEFAIAIISGAESYISSIARYNFVSNYSSLNAQTREMLNDMASNYAAAQYVASDLSKYSSRVEAESMINFHMNNFKAQAELIKDKKVSDFLRSGSSQ